MNQGDEKSIHTLNRLSIPDLGGKSDVMHISIIDREIDPIWRWEGRTDSGRFLSWNTDLKNLIPG